MNYIRKIEEYLEESNGIITATYCRENNIPTIYLSRLVKQGVLSKVAPGIYLTPNGVADELYFFQYRYSKSVFSYETSLSLLGVIDKIVQTIDVTVSRSYKFSKTASKVNIHYVKDDLLDLGVDEVLTMYGNTVRCYSYERTLCDIILHKESIESEVYVHSIRSYSSYKKKNVQRLYEFASKMGIQEKVRQIMELTYE